MNVNGLLTIAELTWIEARRRRVVLAALVCGIGFLIVYAVAVYFIHQANLTEQQLIVRRTMQAVISIGGLFACNFLVVALAVLLPIDTLSGDIQSGVMQTVASKPIRRSDVVLGKWLVFALMNAAYIMLMTGGVALIVRVIMGYSQPNLHIGMALLFLEATVLLTITMLGGTLFNTVTNGIVAFAFYAVAFVGGWIEQIGTMLGNASTRYIGTSISLISPTDVLWRLAAYYFQPAILRELPTTPFSVGSVPSTAMIVWACGFIVVLLALAIRRFQRRAL
jgi:ABC-type transport system involved in multi-copper enzyme maturation permease subunit